MIVSVVKGYVFVVFGFLARLIDSVLVSPCHLFTFASVVVTPPPPSEGLGHLRCGVQDPERLARRDALTQRPDWPQIA